MYLFSKFCRHFFFEIVNYHRIFMIHCGCILKLRRGALEFLKKFLRSHVYVYMCVNKHRDISVSVEECLLSLHMYTRNEIHFLASHCFALLLFSLRSLPLVPSQLPSFSLTSSSFDRDQRYGENKQQEKVGTRIDKLSSLKNIYTQEYYVIILGPRQSRANQYAPFCNVEKFTRICLPICLLCPFRQKNDRKFFAHLPTISTSLLFFSFFSYVCSYVYMSMCSRICDVSSRFLADMSTIRVFLRGSSTCFIF